MDPYLQFGVYVIEKLLEPLADMVDVNTLPVTKHEVALLEAALSEQPFDIPEADTEVLTRVLMVVRATGWLLQPKNKANKAKSPATKDIKAVSPKEACVFQYWTHILIAEYFAKEDKHYEQVKCTHWGFLEAVEAAKAAVQKEIELKAS